MSLHQIIEDTEKMRSSYLFYIIGIIFFLHAIYVPSMTETFYGFVLIGIAEIISKLREHD